MVNIYNKLKDCTGFQWDKHNIDKSLDKHDVPPIESEEVFFNHPFIVKKDDAHSKTEERYYALGRTDENRALFTVFTIRKTLIRVISSRDMTNNERRIYENYL